MLAPRVTDREIGIPSPDDRGAGPDPVRRAAAAVRATAGAPAKSPAAALWSGWHAPWTPGGVPIVAARAVLVVVALAALVLLVRRSRRAAPIPAAVAILARAPLGPGLGVALVEAGGRRLLVGWGKDGVRLLRDLGARQAAP